MYYSLIFCKNVKDSKFFIFSNELKIKIWNISTEKVIPTAKDRSFSNIHFWVKIEHLKYIGI